MARGIYEVKLKDRYFPALSVADAVEMKNNGDCRAFMQEEDLEVNLIVKEEHTMQLFLLAKTMYDMDKFDYKQVEAVVSALAREMGYFSVAPQVAECVITWVERFHEDYTISDLEEWIIG